MKTFGTTAVFGLLPVPSSATIHDGEAAATAVGKIGDDAHRAFRLHAIAGERMATKEELARIGREMREAAEISGGVRACACGMRRNRRRAAAHSR